MIHAGDIGAAVDIGSNSVHLLVGRIDHGWIEPLDDESVQLGLGDVVDQLGILSDEARRAVSETLRTYAATATDLGAARLITLGTEPLRRAANRDAVADDVLRATGEPLLVLSQAAEAELTLLGVTHGRRPEGQLMVLDVGGGSTEMIVVTPGSDPIVGAFSSGSARLTKAFVRHDPIDRTEIEALRSEARRLVAGLPDAAPQRGVTVGGSGTNLVRVVGNGELPGHITYALVERGYALLAGTPAGDVAATYVVSLRRAQQLAAGAALIEAVMDRYGFDVLEVSNASLREGAILAAALAGPAWPDHLSSLVAEAPAASR